MLVSFNKYYISKAAVSGFSLPSLSNLPYSPWTYKKKSGGCSYRIIYRIIVITKVY
jgi:hypothetical protein